MKVLFIGDVVGTAGQQALERYLPAVKQYFRPQVIIVNGENIADGRGITEKHYKWLMQQGCNVVTLGNHAWDQRTIFEFIDRADHLVRPVNLPQGTPGKGVHFVKVNDKKLAVINVLGNVFMHPSGNPFHQLPDLITSIRQETPYILIDFHAEATSEKQALAYLLDGQVSAVLGTHTHVQTNDGRILPRGTAYLTDVGMTGAMNSILGFRVNEVLKRFTTQLPVRLEQETTGPVALHVALLEFNSQGLAKRIEPLMVDEQFIKQISK